MNTFTDPEHPHFLLCTSDTKMTASITALLTQDSDWHIESSDTHAHAIDYLEQHYPALIVIDQTFGGCGFELCAALRKLRGYAEQPVLMLIHDIAEQTISFVRKCGATEFCLRDDNDEALRFRIEQMLKHANIRRDTVRQLEELDNRHNDSLTGLLNHKHFKLKLEQCLGQEGAENRNGAVLLIDVDNFKRVNNSFDYQAGDYMLKAMARRMCAVIRNTDMIMRDTYKCQTHQILGRIGGDEFIVFVDGVDEINDIMTIANRILAAISMPVALDGHEVVLTASIGVALVSKDGVNVDTLLRNAEQAMYAAKSENDESVTFFNQEMESAARTRFLLESELRKAVDLNQLFLHYQPLIESKTGNVTRMEALCRWQHPNLGLISPDEFIPIAEDCGMISRLGDWVLMEACRQIKLWTDQGIYCQRLSINVSTIQFVKADFVDRVRRILDLHQIDGSQLELELTESVFMKDLEENIIKVNQLKDMGFTLAVDDFGTGYSSLSYLKKLPIDTLKIDRSFISHIDETSADMAIIEAILALARRLNFEVVAEGIEEEGQLAFLKSRGCNFYQGYLFSRPLPAQQASILFQQVFNVDANQYMEAVYT